MRGWLGAAAAIATAFVSSTLAGAASAQTWVVDFTAQSDDWTHATNSSPYGLPFEPTVSGTLTVTDPDPSAPGFVQFGPSVIQALNYTTGSRNWTLADVGASSSIYFLNGSFWGFALYFTTPFNNIADHNTAAITAPFNNYIFCNLCVTDTSIRSVPEPGVWGLMLLGMGAVGSGLRRSRRRASLPA